MRLIYFHSAIIIMTRFHDYIENKEVHVQRQGFEYVKQPSQSTTKYHIRK